MATIGVTRGLGDHDLKVHDSNIYIKPFLSSSPEVKQPTFNGGREMSILRVLICSSHPVHSDCGPIQVTWCPSQRCSMLATSTSQECYTFPICVPCLWLRHIPSRALMPSHYLAFGYPIALPLSVTDTHLPPHSCAPLDHAAFTEAGINLCSPEGSTGCLPQKHSILHETEDIASTLKQENARSDWKSALCFHLSAPSPPGFNSLWWFCANTK